jgi:Tfp pilus assembly protein PilF
MLGLDYYNSGDFEKSIALFSMLPQVYDVLVNLGMAYAGNNNFSEAMASWKRALEFNPLGTESLFNMAHLGLMRGERGDVEAAAKSIEQFLMLSAEMRKPFSCRDASMNALEGWRNPSGSLLLR